MSWYFKNIWLEVIDFLSKRAYNHPTLQHRPQSASKSVMASSNQAVGWWWIHSEHFFQTFLGPRSAIPQSATTSSSHPSICNGRWKKFRGREPTCN
ncbi:hypothetical protein TCAL_07588 [Tigriopus californicus]|uniref:Uncharacterized protein n=1 Tax=Tigriopus californicus TaxID=6832 RepID=A0A553PI58_TIGCA|nr:hypothetical protein TCAL_07588 [Tigriopus californicus]|eukprot:TCALIF_07588-PA protein Name:"Protein of unknown function" AED:0.00 eAED:0.00 QI:160/1/1/1/0/0.5/2/69/95